MKRLPVFAALALSFVMAGCATSNYSVGRDFPSENVSKIVKGKTTAKELVQMFGQPYMKTVISATEERWMYTYSHGSATAQSYVFTMNVQSKGTQKTLDLLLKNGVVENYTFAEGPAPAATVH